MVACTSHSSIIMLKENFQNNLLIENSSSLFLLSREDLLQYDILGQNSPQTIAWSCACIAHVTLLKCMFKRILIQRIITPTSPHLTLPHLTLISKVVHYCFQAQTGAQERN